MPAKPRPRRPVQAGDPANGNARRHWRRRRDWAGIVAKLFCAVFALVGLVPIAFSR